MKLFRGWWFGCWMILLLSRPEALRCVDLEMEGEIERDGARCIRA